MSKNNLWFLTLFSLILILGVYYITLPSDIFKSNETSEVSKKIDVDVSENNMLVALRVERDLKISNEMEELQNKIVTSNDVSEKNIAFEELQLLNLSKGKESYLEDKIQNEFNIVSFVEINEDNINVTISSSEHNEELVSKIMKCIQDEFEERKIITIKFS